VEAIERLYPERLTEHAERLAHHAVHGEVWHKAVQYLRQSGTKAVNRCAYDEAVKWLEAALDTAKRLPADRPRTELTVISGSICEMLYGRRESRDKPSLISLRRRPMSMLPPVPADCPRAGHAPPVAHCHLGLGKLYRHTGNREQARERLSNATAMYREMDMPFWLEKAESALKSV
jgi:hypothetical protein